MNDGTHDVRWGDWPSTDGGVYYYMLEWSADCNNDGVVDYAQIQQGTLADRNGNNIPDCCEPGASCAPCLADVSGSGSVDAVDLAALLTAWGTNGQGEFDCDINNDGTVNGTDLAIVLGGWGLCPE